MKYFILFKSLFVHSAKRYLENRVNSLGNLVFMSVNFLVQIFLVQIMFMNTQNLAGWNREEVFLVTGLSRLFGTIFSLFFQRSINHLTSEIAEGNLDLILTKPFSSQFYYSFYLIRAFEVLNLLAPLVLIYYTLSHLDYSFNLAQLLSMIILLGCGIIIFYSIYIMIAAITFWVGRFSAFSSLFNILTVPMSVPTDVYGRQTDFALTFLLPLAFLATIPAKVFLGRLSILYVALGIMLAGLFLYASIRFWNEALKRYSSASS